MDRLIYQGEEKNVPSLTTFDSKTTTVGDYYHYDNASTRGFRRSSSICVVVLFFRVSLFLEYIV